MVPLEAHPIINFKFPMPNYYATAKQTKNKQ